MSYPANILEEELKNKVAHDLFEGYDTTQIVGRIDFCVCLPADPLGLNEPEPLLWAEAKRGTSHDIYKSFIQLILTLGKERPQDRHLPPAFLGAFDAEKIAFLPYNTVLGVLRQNDFNWNVTPSDDKSKEFLQLRQMLGETLNHGLEIYYYDRDAREIFHFIRRNFAARKLGARHIRINRNNFTHIYLKWLEAVKPTININWEAAKKAGIIDADFYLADILSHENKTLGEKLFVLLQDDHYLLDRQVNDLGLTNYTQAQFTDGQVAHTQFWNRYARPPRREYWDDIVNRRDLLVPQDVRERKGSFFTPARWVELSQQYIAAELGENWQDEYYVWDCCAGTGNLLAGLTNKYNVYASTLDSADVQAMHQRIEAGANLLPSHVFQFDFLNDPFDKLPQSLQEIINNPQKRKKLVIYINPPYAEAGTGQGRGFKKGVSSNTNIHKQYEKELGAARKELFAQFFMRVYKEIPSCQLAEFSTLKILQADNFRVFRKNFRAKLGRNFLVPANTFDNVSGDFPIGFMIWDTSQKVIFEKAIFDVFDSKGHYLCEKHYVSTDKCKKINVLLTKKDNARAIGILVGDSPDYQNNKYVCLLSQKTSRHAIFYNITKNNIFLSSIYLAVRLHQPSTWLNDRDQFLYPTDGWQTDWKFQTDCLVYTLFHGQNRISAAQGENHWIPFTEEEVGAQERFESHFMSELLRKPLVAMEETTQPSLFDNEPKAKQKASQSVIPLEAMSAEARAVYEAGRALWTYYHKQPAARTFPDASFYDIRLHFQGTKTTASGKQQMNVDSSDAEYTRLVGNLRQAQKALAAHIAPKVYQYGFLKQ